MNKADYLEFLDENQKIREEKLEGQEFEERPDGWLVDKEYTSADEVIDDILYIQAEYEKERLDAVELDQYFYKRQYLQGLLKKFYADEYVLVNKFNKIQHRLKYEPGAEKTITELAEKLDCYVILRRGNKYFAEVGDETIDMGEEPDIWLIEEESWEKAGED